MALLSTFNSMFRNRVSSLFFVAIILSATLPIFVGCGGECDEFRDGGKTLYRVRIDKISKYTVPEGVTRIDADAFADLYDGPKLKQILVSDGNPNFKSIDGILFSADGKILIKAPPAKPLNRYTVPEGVTRIESNAFHNCTSLTSITLPDSVTSIGSHAFFFCLSLTSITIPDSVTSIESGAFECCNDRLRLTIPDSVTEIGEGAFGEGMVVNHPEWDEE